MFDWISVTLLFALSFVAGLVVKYADFLEDTVKKRGVVPYVVGALYGGLLFFVMFLFPEITSLWVGIVIGLLVIGKIDAPAHYVGVGVFFLLLVMFGVQDVIVWLLLTVILVTVFEELLNDYSDRKGVKNKTLQKIISWRPLLEVTLFIIAVTTGMWRPWLALLGFDIGYILVSKYEKRMEVVE